MFMHPIRLSLYIFLSLSLYDMIQLWYNMIESDIKSGNHQVQVAQVTNYCKKFFIET